MLDLVTIGYLGVLAMLVLAFLGVPLAYSMSFIGSIGLAYATSFDSACMQNVLLAWEQGSSFSLMTIPLFIFMGTIAYSSRIVADLFDCVRKWVGHVPGGLAVAGVLASAAFGAVTGSTAASAATMGSTVMPELAKHKYDMRMSAGSIAASAGLAAIIPPSVFIIIFCVLTDQSIGQVFIATIGPGLLVTALFCIYILIRCAISPEMGPPATQHISMAEKIKSLTASLPVIFVFGIVIGGLYTGVVTPTEASAIGVVGVLIIAGCMRRLTFKCIYEAFTDGAKLSTAIFMLIIGGWLMSRFLVTTGTTKHMVDFFVGMHMTYYVLIAVLFVLFMILGCALEATSILILTMPFLFPITQAYGINPEWFGVFVTMMMVMAGVTPPVGLNVFVVHGVYPDVPINGIFRGALPFCLMVFIAIIIMVIFPEIVLWLPSHMN
ncbi:MAG: TRAP transporter large permease [Mailhella sp.]